MNKLEQLLSNLIQKEELLGLNDYKIGDLPIWRLFRFYSRYKVLKTADSKITNNSLKRDKIRLFVNILRRLCLSVFSLLKFFYTKKNIENVFFAFPRLQNLNGVLVDKFTDPIIDQSNLSESCVVFQTYGSSIYKGNRWKSERIVNIDLLYVIACVCAYIYLPYHYLIGNSKITNNLYDKARDTFLLTGFDLLQWNIHYCKFYILSLLFKSIFSRINIKRIFVVDREVFFPSIFAAHQLNIMVYEIQHGVTCGNTVLYSGKYSKIIDPDFFLIFGERWKGSQFFIPIENVINIGWAYKDFVLNYINNTVIKKNSILFISSPSITENIVKTIIELSEQYPGYKYYIRCHPQEMIPENLKMKINTYSNIYITDNTIDSYIELSSYNYIVGENSTVLYDALSLGKNVARLSYNGFSPVGHIDDDGFFYLHNIYEFKSFLNSDARGVNGNNIYSTFKKDVVNRLK